MGDLDLAEQLSNALGTLLARDKAKELYTQEYERQLKALKTEKARALEWVPMSARGWALLISLFAALSIAAYVWWLPGSAVAPLLSVAAIVASLVYSVRTREGRSARIAQAEEHHERIRTAFEVHKQALDDHPTGELLDYKLAHSELEAQVEAITGWFPRAYLKPDVLNVLITYAANRRVSSLKEAINLYEMERFRQDLIDTQEDIIAAHVAQISQLAAHNASLESQLGQLNREVKKLRKKK